MKRSGRKPFTILIFRVIYDDNRISIEGDTHYAFTEDVSMRYRSYGWHVIEVGAKADGDVVLKHLLRALLNCDETFQLALFIDVCDVADIRGHKRGIVHTTHLYYHN